MATPAGFWQDANEQNAYNEEHQEIAKTIYQNIEYKNPDSVTSRGMCHCLDYCNWCGWAATSVEYPEYTGPDVRNI